MFLIVSVGDLQGVVEKGAVVALVPHAVQVCVPLVGVVDKWTVVAVIRDLCRKTRKCLQKAFPVGDKRSKKKKYM